MECEKIENRTSAFVLFIIIFAAFCVLNAITAAFADPNQAYTQDGNLKLVTPTGFEIMVSTTFPKFTSVGEFRQILTDKTYIADKALSVDTDLQAYQDLQVRYPSLPLSGRINKLKAQLDLLFAIYSSLP